MKKNNEIYVKIHEKNIKDPTSIKIEKNTKKGPKTAIFHHF